VRISVIVPVYRGARFLPLALGSLRRQKLAPADVVVVNDGSPDDTSAVARRLGEGLPGFTLVEQENRGLSGAMNAGLARCRGDWVLELDADDYLADDALAGFGSGARDGIDVVSSHFDTFRFRNALLRPLWTKRIRWPLPDEATQRSRNTVIATSLARRARVEALGGWDERLTAHQDWDLWLRLWTGTNFAKVDRSLVRVWKSRGSMSGDNARMERHRAMVAAHWRDRYAGVPEDQL
jgi:glycosyltransferase involved in cell wall biosynthesis